MSDTDTIERDERDLDRLIDALRADEAIGETGQADADVAPLLDTARQIRALREVAWPAPDYPRRLAAALARELAPRQRPVPSARGTRPRPAARATRSTGDGQPRRGPWSLLVGGANGLAAAALAVVLLGAATLVLTTALGGRIGSEGGATVTADHGPSRGLVVSRLPAPDDLLLAQFRDAQAAVDFPLLLPIGIADYASGGVDQSGPIVEAALTDRRDPERTLLFAQTKNGFGAVAPLTGATARTVRVGGSEARLEEGGDEGRAQLLWRQNGVWCLLTGRNIPAAELLRVAGSLAPLDAVLRERAPRFLSAAEAIDLARFRGYHTAGGEIGGVPRARETLALGLTARLATALIADAERSGAGQSVGGRGQLGDSDTPVILVIVRGPVLGYGDSVRGDGLAMVFSRATGNLLYAAVGPPWDTYTPRAGSALTLPLRDAPNLTNVSRARAEHEIGGGALTEPAGLPAGLTLQRITINRANTQVDPGSPPVAFSFTSVTFVYGDPAAQPRLWFTQTPGTAEFLAPPSAVPTPPDGRRYTWQEGGRQHLAIARQYGGRWFYTSAALGPDLTETAVIGAIPGDTAAAPAPPTPIVPRTATRAPAVTATPFPVTVVAAPEPAYPWVAPLTPLDSSTDRGNARLLPSGDGAFILDATFPGDPTAQTGEWRLLRGACAERAGDRAVLRQGPATSGRLRTQLPAEWLTGPLALLLVDGDGRTPRACADLPVAVAGPPPGTSARTATVQPAPGWDVRGRITVWPAPGGYSFLRAEITGPPEQLARGNGGPNLIWHVARGACAAWADAGARHTAGQVLYRDTPPVDEPGRQTFSLGLLQDWTNGPLVLVAFVNGGGPFVACADLAVTWAATTPGRKPRRALASPYSPPISTLVIAGTGIANLSLPDRQGTRSRK